MQRLFLDPSIPLVQAATDWLVERVRVTPGGVKSLSHLLVVVPTRQSGRRLRLALAERTGGCLPPLIHLPVQVIAPAHEPPLPVATFAETLGLLATLLLTLDLAAYPALFPETGRPRAKTFAWALGVTRQLADLWNSLQENALTLNDVSSRIGELLSGEDLDIEINRWDDLARLETRFFETLHQAGRTPLPLARQQAVAAPALPVGIEEIILPALADAQPALYPVLEKLADCATITVLIHAAPTDDARFDIWGRPEPEQWINDCAPLLPLADDQIVFAANTAEQARLAAEAFAEVSPTDERPALGLADDTLFSELQSAFLTHDLMLHNPANYPLAASSLGRLITQLESLCREPRYATLSAFLREADVMRWLENCFPAKGFSYTAALCALDDLQNTHLPQTLDAALGFCEHASLRTALQAIHDLLDPQERPHLTHLSDMLRTLFQVRTLREHASGDRELAAAASATLAVFEALDSDVLTPVLNDAQRSLLFETLIASATYQLEAESSDALLTEGWLELPWCPARELFITGFNEGAVPDAVVGHAFLPDRLRQALGLTSNERRIARDTYLLQALLAARPPKAVRLFLERVSARNDVRKPSRLLFLCDEATLTARAKKLFSDAENTMRGHPHTLPKAWRLAFPIPGALPEKMSATAFKNYLACPFTFYLRNILKMEACADRAKELDAAAFGTLCHDALEAFGKSDLKDSEDADAIAAFLHAQVTDTLQKQCGEPLSAILHLQAAAACKRLSFFAVQQATLRSEGWRIVEVEAALEIHESGMRISGRADRLDHHEASGAWRIIDYKTWNSLGKNDGFERFCSSSKTDVAFATQRGFAPFAIEGKKDSCVWTDLQLPLYLLMSGAKIPDGAAIECGYFVLGETQEESVCRTWQFDALRNEALDAVRRVISNVRAGIFWPPSPRDVWKWDYASLFLESPEQSVAEDWIADQLGRIEKGGAPCAS